MMLRRLLIVLIFAAATWTAPAFEWQLSRFDGRDYVPIDNIGEFYGLKKETSPVANQLLLSNAQSELAVTLNSRLVRINGANNWLAFPVHEADGKVWASRLDVAKTIEPMLRPEAAAGLKAVRTVVLDAGHGGHDNGAVCAYGREKDFALDVVLRARKLLLARNYKVVLTRDHDVFIPLEDRPRVANRIDNSIFVSVHFNYSLDNALASGLELYSITPRGAPSTEDDFVSLRDLVNEPGNSDDVPSEHLAGSVYHAMVGNSTQVDRGVKHARFAVIRLATVPAILVEGGFLSNDAEGRLIATPSWRARLASAIVDGIEAYKNLAEHRQRPRVVADYRRLQNNSVTLRDNVFSENRRDPLLKKE